MSSGDCAVSALAHLPNEARARVYLRLVQMRSALKIEILTGLRNSRGSVLRAAQQNGYTTARSKRGAYQDVNARIIDLGGEDRPLPQPAKKES